MHKRLVEHIEKIIKESPFKDYYKITIYPQSEGGFWRMKIVAKSKSWIGYLGYIKEFSEAIGNFYSEHLYCQLSKRTLEIS
jgi:hypothetical protein